MEGVRLEEEKEEREKKDGSSGKSNGAAATYTDTRCNGVYVLKEMKQGTALANALFLFRAHRIERRGHTATITSQLMFSFRLKNKSRKKEVTARTRVSLFSMVPMKDASGKLSFRMDSFSSVLYSCQEKMVVFKKGLTIPLSF